MEICVVCSQTEAWHQEHKPKHAFTTEGGGPLSVALPTTQEAPVRGVGDPILRLALLKAGVLTEPDLAVAEEWMKAAREHGKVLMVIPGEGLQAEYYLADLQEAMTLQAGQ